MALAQSLLTAMVRANGDALVMHVGERPYVVVGTGTLELSTQVLQLPAMSGMLQQLLPSAAHDALDEFGAVEHHLPPHEGDAFTVVAARGSGDIWIEIRRHRARPAPAVPVVASESPFAPVLQMTRTVRIEVPPRSSSARVAGVERLLHLAAERSATALFIACDSRPSIRVDGEMRELDGEPVMTRADVMALVTEVVPDTGHEAVGRGSATEWITEFAGLGRVRCLTFTDQRGPGVVFARISTRPATAEQLGLSPEVQALVAETQGLVLVAGSHGAGKSTLISALVDRINRQRSAYVITLERQIRLVHQNHTAIVSQREIRGEADEALGAARAALREDPDVLVVDDLWSAPMAALLLRAASEVLVLATVTAPSATEAVERFINLMPADGRASGQAAMAKACRGVVAQVLLRKVARGRVAAREVLLANAAVTRAISDGVPGQLQVALEGGRKHGMVPLADAVAELVRSGVVDVREAFRQAPDRERLLSALKRVGIDTSLVDRLA